MSLKLLLLCFLNTGLMATGQLLFKYSAVQLTETGPFQIIHLIRMPSMLLAVIIYGSATLLWVYILRYADISLAYPIQTLAVPLVCLISTVLFHERIGALQGLGIFLMMIGVCLIAR